jgi:hypothetical protein
MARVNIKHPTNHPQQEVDNENEHGATQSDDGEEQQQHDIREEDSDGDDDNDDEDCDGGFEFCSQHDPRAIAIQMKREDIKDLCARFLFNGLASKMDECPNLKKVDKQDIAVVIRILVHGGQIPLPRQQDMEDADDTTQLVDVFRNETIQLQVFDFWRSFFPTLWNGNSCLAVSSISILREAAWSLPKRDTNGIPRRSRSPKGKWVPITYIPAFEIWNGWMC